MRTLYNILKTTAKIKDRIKLQSFLLWVLVIVAASLNQAMAQTGNLSDWHVPPPLPPGNLTKGNTTGKEAKGKSIVLSFVDVPVPAQPAVSPVKIPVLANVATTPAAVNTPAQPVIADNEAGLPPIPSPDGPGAPPLPQKSQADVPMPVTVDVPVPTAPEMPPLPAEPVPAAPAPGQKEALPQTPEVVSQVPPALPQQGNFTAWPTIGIPENENIKTGAPTGANGKQK